MSRISSLSFLNKEAEILQNLRHKHIIGFRFLKEFSNYLWLGMELWVGGNLSDWIAEQKKIEKSHKQHDDDWAHIIKNVLEGIKYIHEKHDLIHRDIKPGNILP